MLGGGLLAAGLQDLDPDSEKAGPSPRSTPRPSEDAVAAATASVLMDVRILSASRNAAGTMEYLVATTGGDGRMVAVRHRYSDFVALHAALKPSLGDSLPLLPPSPTPRIKVRAVPEKRQQLLVDYLRRVYACQSEPPLVLLQFFGLEPLDDDARSSKDGDGRTTRSTAPATWGDLREEYLMAMAAEDEDDAWRLGATVGSLMEALLGVEHPLGTLRHALLELFEVRAAGDEGGRDGHSGGGRLLERRPPRRRSHQPRVAYRVTSPRYTKRDITLTPHSRAGEAAAGQWAYRLGR